MVDQTNYPPCTSVFSTALTTGRRYGYSMRQHQIHLSTAPTPRRSLQEAEGFELLLVKNHTAGATF